MALAGRQTTLLLGGAVLAQLIGLAASPLLTRLYGPRDFAALALFGGLLGVLGVVAGGRYEAAVLLPKDDRDARGLLVLALLLSLATALLTALAIGIAGAALAERLGWNGASRWLWLLPLAVPLTTALTALGAWVNRQQDYLALAGSRVVQALVAAGLGVALAGWSGGAADAVVNAAADLPARTTTAVGQGGTGAGAGLVWGSCAGLLAGGAWLAAAAARRRHGSSAQLSWGVLRDIARRHADFPRVNLPHALLDSLQAAALLALLGAGWGATVLGLYALVLRTVRAPAAMLGSAFGQVFQQRAAAAHNAGRPLRPLVLQQWRQLAWWLAPLALVAGSAPWSFGHLFGATWREAGVYALILLPWMAASLLVSPLSQLPLVLGRQRRALLWGLAYQASMLLPLLLALAWQWDARSALALHSLCASAVLVAYAGWLVRISDTPGAAPQEAHG